METRCFLALEERGQYHHVLCSDPHEGLQEGGAQRPQAVSREPLTFAGKWKDEGASGMDRWTISSRMAQAVFRLLLTLLWLQQQ